MEDAEFRGLNAVVFTLGEEFFAVSSAEIASLVGAEYRRDAGRPVRDFIPMLVTQLCGPSCVSGSPRPPDPPTARRQVATFRATARAPRLTCLPTGSSPAAIARTACRPGTMERVSELFAVDGVVNAEKLAELLRIGHETQHLDYKKYWDLSRNGHEHRLELVVAVAAYSNTTEGGYIVVGVDGTGSTEHTEPLIDPTQFDEATLAQMVRGYVSGAFGITVTTHVLASRPVAVIYVAPSPDRLPAIFSKDGELKFSGPLVRVKFRRGQVYVRRGTQCLAAGHEDWTEILSRYAEQIRREARGPVDDILRRLLAAAGGDGMSDLPLAVDFTMDLDIFTTAVTSTSRSQHAALARLARRQVRAASWDAKTPWDLTAVSQLIDRLLVIGNQAIRDEDDELLDAVIDLLVDLYRLPMEERVGDIGGAMMWRTVAAGVAALGGLAVRERAWSAVRRLALPPRISPVGETEGSSFRYQSWLRHAATMAARAGVLGTRQDGSLIPGGLVRFARETATRVPVLAEDVQNAPVVESPEFTPSDKDRVLDSICRFDYLWCTLALLADSLDDRYQALPGFAVFFFQRTAPIVVQLVEDSSMRSRLAPANLDAQWGWRPVRWCSSRPAASWWPRRGRPSCDGQ